MAYPKVLVICAEPFNQERGSGITLSNLFNGWDPQKLATLYWLEVPPDGRVCACHWKLRTLLGGRVRRGGGAARRESGGASGSAPGEACKSGSQGGCGRVKRWLVGLDRHCGLADLLHWVPLPTDTMHQIRAFAPEVIYCPLSSRQAVSLVGRVLKALRVPLVLHVFDDWISQSPQTMLGWLMHSRVRRRFSALLKTAQACLAIGPNMARIYEERYHVSFVPLQNPVDPAVWDLPPKSAPGAGKSLVLRFTGNLYQQGNLSGMVEFARAFELVPSGGRELRFEIYAPSSVVAIYSPLFSDCRRTKILPVPVDTVAMLELYQGADGLVIVVDADEGQGGMLGLSMPTKLPSVLMSGRPLLIYAPAGAALAQFVKAHGVGSVIHTPAKSSELAQGIAEFLGNPEKTRALAAVGKRVALDQFSTTRVRPIFARVLRETAAQKPRAGSMINGSTR